MKRRRSYYGKNRENEKKPLLSQALLACEEGSGCNSSGGDKCGEQGNLISVAGGEDVAEKIIPAAFRAGCVDVVKETREEKVSIGERGCVFEEKVEKERLIAVESVIGGEDVKEMIEGLGKL